MSRYSFGQNIVLCAIGYRNWHVLTNVSLSGPSGLITLHMCKSTEVAGTISMCKVESRVFAGSGPETLTINLGKIVNLFLTLIVITQSSCPVVNKRTVYISKCLIF